MRRHALLGLLLGPLSSSACAAHPLPRRPIATAPIAPPAPRAEPAKMRAPDPPPERWYFEWLSRDGKRALLRRIDGHALSDMQTRVVDVDTGAIVEEAPLEELGRLPSQTLGPGSKERDVAALDAMIAEPAFASDLQRGAELARAFPFGSLGRFSAAPNAIAFNAGDWVYVADKAGRVKKRLADEASYDPRFTPDGKHLLFRREAGKIDGVFAKYELFVVPADLSAAPKPLAGTAGARDRSVVDGEGRAAIVIASHEPAIRTCVLAVALKAPFAVKKLACLEGGEPLVDAVLSPKGKWAAMTTTGKDKHWHLRVVSLATGKLAVDEPAETGLVIRAISDEGLLVQSGPKGIFADDVRAKPKKRRELDLDVDLGHRGFFRSGSELVFVTGGAVAVARMDGPSRNR